MTWNELHDRVDAALDAMEDLDATTDCEAMLRIQLAEHLSQARNILHALAADAAARTGS